MRYRNDDLLLRIAQGDAYGAGFEYVKRENRAHWAKHRVDRYVRHPTHNCCGDYTDDTQMSIAVAEVLLAGPPFTREAFADAFVRCFKRDEREGYSSGGREGGFQRFLESVRDGKEFLARIRSDSDKNGAMMRAVPIGVLPRLDWVLEVAELQAKITHDTPDGIRSAQAAALLAHCALWTDTPLDHLRTHSVLAMFSGRWRGEVRGDRSRGLSVARATAHAVYDLVAHATTLRDVFQRGTAFGGDVDSVLAVAVGISSCRLRDPLPAFLERDLEVVENVEDVRVTSRTPKPYGVPFLKDLGRRLMEKYAPAAG
ncbi:ADP-ribosylglycohydrolase family protein [Candidatus Uhrbacteria bacterium]|nr:ADP-ribosylglycohydrolase family protein [Candidatus Uhrbacteria bacterium]